VTPADDLPSETPPFEKKLRVVLDWTLDIFFSKDFVQYLHERAPVIADASDVRPSSQPASDGLVLPDPVSR
jgi:hypothetical protein